MADFTFRSEKIQERITRIYAFSTELMYLVEGNDRAALLDTGSGIGFVRPYVETLTSKPISVFLTHGHVDHAMGASEFPPSSVWINWEDTYIYGPHSTYEFRRDGLCLIEQDGRVKGEITDKDFTPIRDIHEYNDLKDGEQFDLGGISLVVLRCPGHTRGSLVFLIPELRTVLFGDSCNAFTFLFEDYSESIETTRQSYARLKKQLAGRYDTAFGSHGDGILVPEILEENIALCDRILEGTADQIPFEFRGHHGLIADGHAQPHHGNIVYCPDRVRDRQIIQ